MVFVLKKGEQLCPVIYLEDYFRNYQNGETVEKILEDIYNEYYSKEEELADKESQISDLQMNDFKISCDKIIYRLVNYKKNKEILKECPYIRLYDLAVTFRWIAFIYDTGIGASLITHEQMNSWGISMNELLLAAIKNTPRLFPCKIIDINNMLRKVNYPFPKEYFYLPIYVMTNEQETNEASILLYESALKGFADTKESDMYIFPACIHEVILIPVTLPVEPSELFSMVRNINRICVPEKDILSDSVYYYSREKDKLLLLKDGDSYKSE